MMIMMVNIFVFLPIFQILTDYNKSVICYENTLKIQPDIEQALKRKHAVLCHAKVEQALETQHKYDAPILIIVIIQWSPFNKTTLGRASVVLLTDWFYSLNSLVQ